MIWTILFYAGFLLFILLFSEEFARAIEWFRVNLAQYPQYRIIAYPLILALLLMAGIIIVLSFTRFITSVTFSYD